MHNLNSQDRLRNYQMFYEVDVYRLSKTLFTLLVYFLILRIVQGSFSTTRCRHYVLYIISNVFTLLGHFPSRSQIFARMIVHYSLFTFHFYIFSKLFTFLHNVSDICYLMFLYVLRGYSFALCVCISVSQANVRIDGIS